jgi:hypothetical protein
MAQIGCGSDMNAAAIWAPDTTYLPNQCYSDLE